MSMLDSLMPKSVVLKRLFSAALLFGQSTSRMPSFIHFIRIQQTFYPLRQSILQNSSRETISFHSLISIT